MSIKKKYKTNGDFWFKALIILGSSLKFMEGHTQLNLNPVMPHIKSKLFCD